MGGAAIIAMHPRLVIDDIFLIFCYVLPSVTMILFMICEINKQADRVHVVKIRKHWLRHLFVIYCLMLATVLIFHGGHRNTLDMETVKIFSKEHFQMCNIIPFHTLGTYISRLANHSINLDTVIKNIFGNVMLFMPLGFFFCTLFKKKVKFWFSCLIYTFIISFVVEIIQFVTFRGVSDVDDIILNCLGALFSYLFFKSKLFRWIDSKQYFCT